MTNTHSNINKTNYLPMKKGKFVEVMVTEWIEKTIVYFIV